MPLVSYVIGSGFFVGAMGVLGGYVADKFGGAAKNSEAAIKASQGVIKESSTLVDKFATLIFVSGGVYVVYKLLNR